MVHSDAAAAAPAGAMDRPAEGWRTGCAQRLVELARPRPGDRVLDAATGTGQAAAAAARLAGPQGKVTGVDIGAGKLDRLRRSLLADGLTNVELRHADATYLDDYDDASFDMVVCSAALLALPVGPALREWHRLLAPGGLVAFSSWHVGFPTAARLFRRCAAEFGLELDDPSAPLGTVERCRVALERAAFTPVTFAIEPVRLSDADLARAWRDHAERPHGQALAGLAPERRALLRRRYRAALAEALAADERAMREADVIYALGRK
ncbi:class I SAM-dependent methyltransferase [Allonocardiopsis opalescens]|uniref:Methyltransferase family protein n=1 Tax=Allonocardiopsis opalescens TaxID=1144618 RepID=A0A2T0QFG7_9ACTN|nr:methyltransferase domain-containing protein [Allonocardiopsis opalescens]PRY02593.1 methyltransferase family protein [Allonocardiopsis opalescens]